jgi:hypothetical protein
MIKAKIADLNTEQKNNVSRARFLRSVGIFTLGIMLASQKVFASQEIFESRAFLPKESPGITIIKAPAKDPTTVQALRGNVHVLQGSGSNISVFDGPDGKLMVNAGISVSQKKIQQAINKKNNSKILKNKQ